MLQTNGKSRSGMIIEFLAFQTCWIFLWIMRLSMTPCTLTLSIPNLKRLSMAWMYMRFEWCPMSKLYSGTPRTLEGYVFCSKNIRGGNCVLKMFYTNIFFSFTCATIGEVRTGKHYYLQSEQTAGKLLDPCAPEFWKCFQLPTLFWIQEFVRVWND